MTCNLQSGLGGNSPSEWNQWPVGVAVHLPVPPWQWVQLYTLPIWSKNSNRKAMTSKFNQKSQICLALRQALFFPKFFFLSSWVLCKPPTSWLLASDFLLHSLADIYEFPLWLTLYPGPILLLKMALKKGKPRTCLPSSFFLKMSVFLLLPNPVLKQHLKLDDSA